jgi:hypothetical protein
MKTTKTKFNASMFEKIKDALNKTNESSGSSAFANVMKFPAGKTYTVRLIPNLDDPEKTFFHHYTHGWKSKVTGSYISTLSLQTFNDRDPITETFWKLIKSEDQSEKELGKIIRRKENWFVNIYVIDDPSNPENNGTVKVLKIGPQIKKIIDDALTGDGADEFGARIFDLGPEGANLKIKAEGRGDYTTFESSGFYNKPVLNLDDEEIEDIYSKVHDLEQIYPVKTFDELEEILNTHFFGKSSDVEKSKPSSVVSKSTASKYDQEDEEDEIPFDFPAKKEVKKAKPQIEDVDDEIDALLDQLDS